MAPRTPDQRTSFENILKEIKKVTTLLHPERTIAFFRNLKLAHSMLTYTKDYAERTGKLREDITVAFNVGLYHAGIENFLKVGPDVCRFLISRYPKFYLEKVNELNDPGALYSIRVAELPRAYNINDSNLPLNQSGIKERKIEDKVLKEILSQKLGHDI